MTIDGGARHWSNYKLYNKASAYSKKLNSDYNKDTFLKCIEWLNFQTASQGPMLGQAHHFLKFNKGKSIYAEKRYKEEAERLYQVINKRLNHYNYLGGSEFSIVDIATWPWIARFEWHQVDITKYEKVCDWYNLISARNAVKKGYDIPKIGALIPKI